MSSFPIYEVADSELVKPLSFEPAVVDEGVRSKKGWLDAAVDWYQDPSRWSIPLADDGPQAWDRVTDAADPPTPKAVRPVEVSNIESDDDSISFDVDEPGTPVLVKASYFPNWKAKGADGPYRVTPNQMVVVPTSKHVELHYGWTGLDLGAWAITLLGIAGVVLVARRRPVRLPEPLPPAPEEHVDPFVVDRSDVPEPAPAEVLSPTATP